MNNWLPPDNDPQDTWRDDAWIWAKIIAGLLLLLLLGFAIGGGHEQ
jgi:hypothetical protein